MTGHARVLVCIASDPTIRVIDIARATNLTERSVHSVIRQLVNDGALDRQRMGRRNMYRVIDEYQPREFGHANLNLGQWLVALNADRNRP